jgi:hypothetical protein
MIWLGNHWSEFVTTLSRWLLNWTSEDHLREMLFTMMFRVNRPNFCSIRESSNKAMGSGNLVNWYPNQGSAVTKRGYGIITVESISLCVILSNCIISPWKFVFRWFSLVEKKYDLVSPHFIWIVWQDVKHCRSKSYWMDTHIILFYVIPYAIQHLFNDCEN